jgi:Bacterial regulatory helix-turn-helix protein, lysR family
MELQQVRYFLALYEEQNFTRAATRCGVSQPSVTNAIKRLEVELGGSLFRRDRTNTRLTDLGIIVRPDLVQIDRSATEAKRKAKKFSAVPSVSHQPRIMEAFMRAHHVIAVVAILVIGLGANQFLFPPKQAEANLNAVADMPAVDIRALEATIDIKSLPVQNILSEADPDLEADIAPTK